MSNSQGHAAMAGGSWTPWQWCQCAPLPCYSWCVSCSFIMLGTILSHCQVAHARLHSLAFLDHHGPHPCLACFQWGQPECHAMSEFESRCLYRMLAQASADSFWRCATTMVVAEMMACHAPPLWILVVLMLSWTKGIMHEHVPWLHYIWTNF